MNKHYCLADWPAPENVHCLLTTRLSQRETLQQDIGQENHLQSVKQVHGSKVHSIGANSKDEVAEADALFTTSSHKACLVLTADCLPVFFCDQKGQEIAVAHAGWRGLLNGVLENTLSCFKAEPQQVMAWFGPAIGPCHFEVGNEVREAFIDIADITMRDDISAAFVPSVNEAKWMADLFEIARRRLSHTGIGQIFGGGVCTFCDAEKFYSYRRNKDSGRMASVIWKD